MTGRPAAKDQTRLAIPDRPRAQTVPRRPLSVDKIAELATSGITATEAAKLLDTTPGWVAKLARRGELICLRTPFGRLYDRAEIRRLAEARRIAQAGRPRRGRPRKDDPRYQPGALSA